MNPMRLTLMVAVLVMAFAFSPAMLSAEEGLDDPDVVDAGEMNEDEEADDEGPAFNNPAQAQKAENVANRAALNSEDPDLAEAVEKAEIAEQELAEAQEELDNLPEDATEEERREAEEKVELAEENVRQARADVAAELERVSGELKADIAAFRAAGYGWGVIAQELGVHPSALGLGNKFGHRNKARNMERSKHARGKKGDLAAATERDVKTGWGKGHGVSARGKSKGGGRGNAGALDGDIGGKGKGKSGNAGKGRGGGNAGGNGKGGGNAGGNGKGGGKGKK